MLVLRQMFACVKIRTFKMFFLNRRWIVGRPMSTTFRCLHPKKKIWRRQKAMRPLTRTYLVQFSISCDPLHFLFFPFPSSSVSSLLFTLLSPSPSCCVMEEKETRPETPPDNNSNDNSERRFFLGPRPATTAALDLLPSVTVFSTIPIASTSTPHPLLPDTAGLTQYATLEGPAVPTFPSTSENAALQEPFHSFYNMDPHSYKSRLLPQQPQQQQEQQQQQEEQQQHDPVAQPDYPVLLQQEEHVWPAAWRTASMRTPRRDRVMAMLNPPSSQLQPRLSDASAQKQVRDSRYTYISYFYRVLYPHSIGYLIYVWSSNLDSVERVGLVSLTNGQSTPRPLSSCAYTTLKA